ncbi:hypothetical protein HHI36_005266 [Cryptolaemus montrouzieri]|uniref:Uncharacterized protein n=1 Tax=Cryptolaemus montrouzieri TaxID=559131 RepID=A0ABD2NTL5_9CUCU
MDAKQFPLLLKTMNEQQKTLLEVFSKKLKMQRQDDSSTSKSDYHVNITPFEEFESRKEKFTFYLERLENNCLMQSFVNAEKKAQLLCKLIGSAHYINLAVLLGPEKSVKVLNYDELVKKFCTMLVPFKSAVISQQNSRRIIHRLVTAG